MSVKNKGCGCLTLIMAAPAALLALGFLKSCVTNAFSPRTSYYEDIPGTTNKFVKEQLSGYRSASTGTRQSTPTGSFTVDVKSKSGKDRQFQFHIKGRDSTNNIKMDVKEIGDGACNFGGPVKFNVVFWNPSNEENKGLNFQVNFNQNGGCYVTTPNAGAKTVYIAHKERVCAKRFSSGEVFFATVSASLGKEQPINQAELILPESFVKITQNAIQAHEKYNGPFEPEKQQYIPRSSNGR